MYINIILLPILGSLIAGIRGRYIGTTGAHILTTLCLILSSVLSIVAFYEVCLCQSSVSIDLFNWLNIESIYLNWGFIFDTLTVSILLPVLFVSSLVHLYSIDYIANDPHNQRFISYLSIFTFFMIILVTGNNYVVIFVGWEGIGISSYLLINFWFTRIQANKSAIKALTVNRIGDIFLTVGLFILLWICGHLDYITLFSLGPYFNENIITIAGLLLLIGAMAKSAQLGLHTWLPDAIEGPTPVSALIHAATLVTAGVYLIVRSSPLLEYAPTVLIVTTWVGTLTAFFAATTGLLQNDLKRVIAYSTCSQIGYLFIAVGLANYNVALFHLVNHAFFKALLFLAAGAVIHGISDQQDIRRLGGLINFMPFVYTTILIGSLSLIAVPFLTGFYSKDLILELAYGQYQISGTVAYWLGTLSASLTAFYSYRLISLTFLTTPNAPRNDYIHAHEPGIITVIPLFILSLLSIGFGYIAKDLYVGIGTDALSDSLYQLPTSINLVEAEFALPLIIKLLPAIGTLLGATLSFYLYNIVPFNTIYISIKGRFIYIYLNGKWLFDIVYNNIINNGMILGLLVSKSIDRGIIEIVGPYGLSNNLISTSNQTRYYDGGGYITTYALYIILGILVFTSIILINLFIHNVIYINIIYIFIIILCSFTLLPKLSKV